MPLLVDPKVPHIGRYAGATLLTPNHHEAEAASGVRIRTAADARRAARALAEQVRVDGVLITWGEHGLWLSYGAVEGHLPAAAREVADVTGAGDTVAATMGARPGRRRDPGRSRAAGQRGGWRRGDPLRHGRGHRRRSPRAAVAALQASGSPDVSALIDRSVWSPDR